MVPVVFSPEYLRYDFGPEHPFSPVRLLMLTELLEALGQRVDYRAPRPATREEVLGVHSERLVRRVEAASRGERPPDLIQYGLGTGDTPVFPGMDQAARAIAGGTLEAVRLAVGEGHRRVLQLGGGLHHAQYDRASGFCVYNDLAVATRWALDRGLRVAYLDVDVHHGDGVQWIFYEEPRVLTISLHESGRYLFPGTGDVYELGRGPALGSKLNLPLEPFTEDESWLEAFELVVPEALEAFAPDLVLVQAGADAHYRDPLADLLLTTRAYLAAFGRVLELAERHSRLGVVFTLGGGYSLDATPRVWALLYLTLVGAPLPERLPEEWRRRWEGRLGVELSPTLLDSGPAFEIPRRDEIARRNRHTAERVRELFRQHRRG